MSSSRTLVLASLCRLERNAATYFSGFRLCTQSTSHPLPPFPSPRFFSSFLSSPHYTTPLPIHTKPSSGRFCSSLDGDFAIEREEFKDEDANPTPKDLILEIPPDSCSDRVEDLLSNSSTHKEDEISKLMKMERNLDFVQGKERWFPYLDKFKAGNGALLSSGEVLEALSPYLMDSRKERFRNAVGNRSYSVCLVVEGLCDFGNVSAAFRSADALGFQSVHVVSCDSSKRYRDNRHVSMGAEKWLDIELWDSTRNCFEVLKSRGYRIATTHLGTDAVSIYDMDWSRPIAIVVGNEGKGISEEALRLSDLRCSIPMKGMVDSFNVSVAAGILMHHAVCDRISRLGSHGDLTSEENQILLAEFFLRHNQNTISIVNEFAKRKIAVPLTSSKM